MSADTATGHKAGVAGCFPGAGLIIDRFHPDKAVNTALDHVRKRTNRELKAAGLEYPTGVRYTVLHREARRNGVQKAGMEGIRMYDPEPAKAFDRKEEFFELFDATDRHEAGSRFFSWYNRVRGSRIPEMVEVSGKMLKRLNDILGWFDHRINNAVSEGLNNTYKKIKSAAYGFRKEQNLIDFCLFRKGRLKVSI